LQNGAYATLREAQRILHHGNKKILPHASEDEDTNSPWHRVIVKRIATAFLAIFVAYISISAFADEYVRGYTRRSGTYVQPYYRSSPDNTVTNNFSYKGNINPHTGARGTTRYIHDPPSPYYQGSDSYGRVGHNSAPNEPQEMLPPNQPQGYHNPNSVSVCPPPHFRMTERDGCQAVR
jgi:hypothetical protein